MKRFQKNYFEGKPYEFQISYKVGKLYWGLFFNKYEEPDCFKSGLLLGNLHIFWCLPKKGKDY